MKQSIKTITLKRLMGVAAAVIIILMVMIAYNFKELTISAMRDKGQTVAHFIKAGLTTHMKMSTHEEKEQYKKNIQEISDVQDLTVISSKEVNQQYSVNSNLNSFKDPIIANVFKSKEPSYLLEKKDKDQELLRVTFPYIAEKTEKINCLQCHDVAKDTVLGAVDFYIDVTNYKDMSINYLYVILGILFIILLSILYTMFNIIDKHIKNPLDVLINETRNSYETHTSININDFDSMELEDVAQKVNLFNQEIIEKNDALEKKNFELTVLNKEIEETQKEIINKLGNVAETRSKETAYHVQRVAEYSYLLAKHYGLSEKECKLLRDASPMHDIGKVGIPDEILKKPGKLTTDEFEIMKEHAEMGYSIFKDTNREMLKAAAVLAHEHHEKWDGTGYPRKLKGEEIHIFGRITALADVFDALGTKRVYKDAWELEKILDLVQEERGKQFDPTLVDIFLNNLDDFLSVRDRLVD